ncbi:MAG: AsmA family protein, partial [Bacteroidia bacterium]
MENEPVISAKKPFYKRIFKFFLWIIVFVFLVVTTGITLVFIYEDEVKVVVIKELNKHLATEVRIDPENIDLTFISSFPKCAIEFKKLTAMETLPGKNKDTLLYAESVSLQFNLKDLFNKKYNIKQISLQNATCDLKVDKNGVPNYEVWKSTSNTISNSNDSLQFNLEDIILKNITVSYKNKQQKIKTSFIIDDLAFKGNFSEKNYEMQSKGKINLNSISSDKGTLFKNKKLKIDVELNVAGNSYTLRNADFSLNQMLFDINGAFTYNDSLQDMKLTYQARNLDIESVLSLLPEKHKSHINDYKSSGEFFVNGDLNYVAGKPLFLETDFGIKKAVIEYTPKNTK